MKKLAITCALLSSFVVSQVWADAASDLKSRLDKVSSFHSSFTQKVTDGSGNAVQDGQGELWVKRPNLFNWHMTQPDESVLVSDGKTLWFYNPFVEQATATWLKDATSNTPFMLIARNQASDWQNYNIKQNGDDFVLTPKNGSGNLKQFTINVGRDGTIHQFSAVEQDDQRSSYQLKSPLRRRKGLRWTINVSRGEREQSVARFFRQRVSTPGRTHAARKFSAVHWSAASAGAG